MVVVMVGEQAQTNNGSFHVNINIVNKSKNINERENSLSGVLKMDMNLNIAQQVYQDMS